MATRRKPESQRNDVEPKLLYGRLEHIVDLRVAMVAFFPTGECLEKGHRTCSVLCEVSLPTTACDRLFDAVMRFGGNLGTFSAMHKC